MADRQIQAAFYLSPTTELWWRWADAQTLTWADGRTIAFAPELKPVLERLSSGGLPPFGSVALFWAACRDGWHASPGRATVQQLVSSVSMEIPGDKDGTSGSRRKNNSRMRAHRASLGLLEGLDAVAALPAELRGDQLGRITLAEMVFEGGVKRGTPEQAAAVVEAFEQGLRVDLLRPSLVEQDAYLQHANQIDGLAEALKVVDAEALRLRMATGLEQSVVAPEEDLSPPQRVRNLLAQLRSDPVLAGLAALAQELIAAVGVPRRLRHHEELPIGGVSDLSNRGPLDRLILSELAHDDLTLAARVAVNEALYLRREGPPREPPHGRAILLDAGVRSWGVPRIFIAAVGLALVATQEADAPLQVYRTDRGALAKVDLTTRQGLESHLASLDVSSHPGDALASFAAQAKSPGSEASAIEMDRLVVTTAAAAADPDFIRAAADTDDEFYLATVDRDGSFLLTARNQSGQRPIRQARLSLKSLLQEPSQNRRSQKLKDEDVSLPAIFSAEPFPLLLSHRPQPADSVVVQQDVVSLTRDQRLLWWAQPRERSQRGALQLAGAMPRGRVVARSIDEGRRIATFVVMPPSQTALHVVRALLDTAGYSHETLTEPLLSDVERVFLVGSTLCLVAKGVVHLFETHDTICRVGEVALPAGAKWVRQSIFKSSSSWLVLSPGKPASLIAIDPKLRPVDVFWSAEWGPVVVRASGECVTLLGKKVGQIDWGPTSLSVVDVSPAGDRLIYSTNGERRFLQLGESRVAPRMTGDLSDRLLGPDFGEVLSSLSAPRTRFGGVAVTKRGSMALLKTLSSQPEELQLSGGSLRLVSVQRDQLAGEPLNLVDEPRHPALGIAMKSVQWKDGSKLWLDYRGLLHLRSANTAVQELTLVLNTGALAGWRSDGVIFGSPYHQPPNARVGSAAEFFDVLRQFVGMLPT